MPSILITGGMGFIGGALVAEYAASGFDVVVLDDLSRGQTTCETVEGVEYIIGNTIEISTLLEDREFKYIFHFGEYARVEASFEEPNKVWESNILGTKAVVDYCMRNGSKLIYAGSSTKFADEGGNRNQSPYAWSKASNTDFIKNYGSWYGLNYAILYFYNVYGPGENEVGPYATLIGRYKKRCRDGAKPQVVLPGTQMRNFTHIFDVIRGIKLVAEKGLGDGFGIGAAEQYSVLEVAKMFSNDIEFLEPRRGNRMTGELVIDRTVDLGWRQAESLEEYIRQIKENNWLDI